MSTTAARRDIADHFESLARRVGARVLALQGRAGISHKAPGDLVTEADRLSHELIAAELAARYPGVALVMEEQDNVGPVPSHCIVVDELDGTNVYAHGADEFAITIAMLENGRPIAGAMHQPARGVSIVAVRDGGAFLNGERLVLDQQAKLDEHLAIMEVNRNLPDHGWRQLHAIATRALVVRCFGTAVGSAIEVLRGRAAVYINWRGAKVWDFAAASLAIEQAGGAALSCTGESLSWTRIEMSALFAANQQAALTALSCLESMP